MEMPNRWGFYVQTNGDVIQPIKYVRAVPC